MLSSLISGGKQSERISISFGGEHPTKTIGSGATAATLPIYASDEVVSYRNIPMFFLIYS